MGTWMSSTMGVYVVLAAMALPMQASGQSTEAPPDTWLAAVGEVSEKATEAARAAPAAPVAPAPAKKAPPLPLHTIEGVGGVAVVPVAYLVNPGPEGTNVGLPSVSVLNVSLGKMNLQTFAVSQTFFRRLEVGYAVSRFDLGTLPKAISKAGLRIHRQEVYLHHFNLRAMLLEENSFGLPLPAVTAGVHFKVNGGIRGIDNSLGGALSGIGLSRRNGVDYTLTASKTFAKLAFGRPVILTAGVRNSAAAQLGYLGFSDERATTIEASAVCLVTDRLALGYEFRQKSDPYDRIGGLIDGEDNWHTVCAGFILNEHMAIYGAWGFLGNVLNSDGTCAWAIAFHYEF